MSSGGYGVGGAIGRHNRPGGRRRGGGDGSVGNGHHGHHVPRLSAHGLVARIKPIRHVTPRRVLDRSIYLPAVLNALAVTKAALHTDYDTLSEGQFSQPAMGRDDVETQLTTVPIDSITMMYDPSWLVVRHQSPRYVRDALERIVQSRKPVHLLVHWHPHRGGKPEIALNVTLRSAVTTIQPGENDTLYWTFDVHQWRDPTIPVHSSRPDRGGGSRKRGVDDFPATHKLRADDTLHSLAHEYYGTYRHWRDIRDANGIPHRWGPKTPLVKLRHYRVGSKIIIPPPARNHRSSGGAGIGP